MSEPANPDEKRRPPAHKGTAPGAVPDSPTPGLSRDTPRHVPLDVRRDVPRNLKPYFLCFLIKGPQWDNPEGAETLMPAQLAFLREQIEWRRYKLAGPVTDSGDIVGFSILEAASMEAALALANTDPAVVAGRVAVRLLPAIFPALDSLKVEFPKNGS